MNTLTAWPARLESHFPRTSFWLRHLARSFLRDNCQNVAGVLAFTTLLSVVPLMVVTIGVFSVFPAFEHVLNDIEKFIFSNFVPTAGDQIRKYLVEFTHRASQATTVGLSVLAATAIVLLTTIERSLNAIWKTESRRHWVLTVVIYWAVLTLGPMLIGASLVMSSRLGEWLPELEDLIGRGYAGTVLAPLPLLATFLALCLLFTVIPARRMPFRFLAAGAGVGAVLFELAKHGFGYYVHNLTSYEKIYGTLAALPIFLVWTYISWVIVLLAAEISHTLYVFPRLYSARNASTKEDLSIALELIGHLWRAQQNGTTVTTAAILRSEPALSGEQFRRVLQRLERGQIVQRLQNGGLALVRDVHTLTLADLLRSHRYLLPTQGEGSPETETPLGARIQAANSQLEQSLNVPLVQFLADAAATKQAQPERADLT